MRLTYTGDAGRYYSTLGITPEPGDEVDLEVDPNDGRWKPADAARPARGRSTPDNAEPAGSDAAPTAPEEG